MNLTYSVHIWHKLHLWFKSTLSHKAEHSQLKTKFLALSPALVCLMPGGACGQFEFEFGFEFNLVPVFAPKNLLAICWRLAWAKISFVVIRPAASHKTRGQPGGPRPVTRHIRPAASHKARGQS